ncbi:MAG: hypothetical protein ABSE62_05275 [Chthoniobacteraceae bacterium]
MRNKTNSLRLGVWVLFIPADWNCKALTPSHLHANLWLWVAFINSLLIAKTNFKPSKEIKYSLTQIGRFDNFPDKLTPHPT